MSTRRFVSDLSDEEVKEIVKILHPSLVEDGSDYQDNPHTYITDILCDGEWSDVEIMLCVPMFTLDSGEYTGDYFPTVALLESGYVDAAVQPQLREEATARLREMLMA